MQLDLVWKIAAIYHQSPSPRQMGYLYANVGATAFLASEIEEIDFAEMVQPLVYSSLSGIPGAIAFSSILVNSLSTGAANAFLTLRVGAVARLYCEATTSPVRGAVRRSAIASAAKHLGRILRPARAGQILGLQRIGTDQDAVGVQRPGHRRGLDHQFQAVDGQQDGLAQHGGEAQLTTAHPHQDRFDMMRELVAEFEAAQRRVPLQVVKGAEQGRELVGVFRGQAQVADQPFNDRGLVVQGIDVLEKDFAIEPLEQG
jgi:hypothetical protein